MASFFAHKIISPSGQGMLAAQDIQDLLETKCRYFWPLFLGGGAEELLKKAMLNIMFESTVARGLVKALPFLSGVTTNPSEVK